MATAGARPPAKNWGQAANPLGEAAPAGVEPTWLVGAPEQPHKIAAAHSTATRSAEGRHPIKSRPSLILAIFLRIRHHGSTASVSNGLDAERHWPKNTVEIYSIDSYHDAMDSIPYSLWIAAVAHYLHLQWRTVGPVQLDETARELERDPGLRMLPPDQAVALWLKPVETP